MHTSLVQYHTAEQLKHICDAVVHDGVRPYGAFLLIRSEQNGAFTKDELATLNIAMSLLPSAFNLPVLTSAPTKPTYDLGIVVVDQALNRQFGNLTAHQILWMLTRNTEVPMQLDADDQIDTLIQQCCTHGVQQAIKNSQYTETKHCHWGEFLIQYLYDSAHETVAISLQQMQPYPCHIAVQLSQENLTPVRLMITWLLLNGLVRKEIAQKLDISETTCAEHIQDVFRHFSVNSTNELILKVYR